MRALVLAIAVLAMYGTALDGSAMAIQSARRDADGLFLNGAGELDFADPAVTLPFFARRLGSMLTGRSGYPETVANDGAFLRENASHSTPTVTWIGHATLLVQLDHA